MKLLRIWIICFFLTFNIGNEVEAQSYKILWGEVDKLMKNDYPQSVIDKSQRIYQKAVSEKNVPQMLKAYLTIMRERNKLTPDSFYVDIQALENWAADSGTSVGDAAVIHSLLGEIYYNTSSARGDIQHHSLGILLKDMTEWSRTMYLQQAFKHYRESVKELEKLQECRVKDYEPLTEQGYWSDYYNHDLMHLIGLRAALGLCKLERLSEDYEQTPWGDFPLDYAVFENYKFQPASDYDCRTEAMRVFYRMQTLLQHSNAQGGWLLLELNRLKMIPTSLVDTKEYIRVLEALKTEFTDCEMNAVVYYDLATAYGMLNNKVEQLRLVREAMKTYPHYGAINLFRNMEKEILLPAISWHTLGETFYGNGSSFRKKHFYPHDTLRIKVNYKNLSKFKFWIHEVNLSADTVSNHQSDLEWLKKHSSFHSERSFSLKNDEQYQCQDTTLNLVLPEAGIYLVETLANQKASEPMKLMVVSRLFLRELNYSPADELRLMVLDAKSGHPVPNATVVKGWRENQKKYKVVKTYRTNSDGIVRLDKDDKNTCFRAYTADDNVMLFKNKRGYLNAPREEQAEQRYAELFTDRDLYRPGQSMKIKGIVYRRRERDSFFVAPGEKYKLILHGNGNRNKVIDSLLVETNDYGSVSGEFTLPSVGMNNVMVRIVDAVTNRFLVSRYIRIEEYKRPSFEVVLDTVRQAYAMGDSVTLTGVARTFSGVPLADAKVEAIANIYFSHYRDYWRNRNSQSSTLNLPLTKTDKDGRFRVKVYLKPNEELTNHVWWSYKYRVEVMITSPSGESHVASTNLQQSSCPLLLNVSCAQSEWLKGSGQTLTFDVRNLSQSPVDTRVRYQLIQTDGRKDQESISNKQCLKGTVVREGVAPSNQKLSMEWLDSLPSGIYQIVAQTALPGEKDSVSTSSILTLYTEHETKVPKGYEYWHKWTQKDFAEGEPARLQFGVKENDIYVVMDISTEQRLLETRTFIMSDTIQTFTFDYESSCQKGLNVRLTYVKDGCSHDFNHTIEVKRSDKNLKLKWVTFRDKLRPGQHENWTLYVSSPTGIPVNAEVLASMYDASLDKLGRLTDKWNINLSFSRMSIPSWFWIDLTQCSTIYSSIDFDFTRLKVSSLWKFDDFIDELTNMYSPIHRNTMFVVGGNANFIMKSASQNMRLGAVADGYVEEQVFACAEIADGTSDASSLFSMRDNFDETAFFQPHLRTDSLGNVQISFTLPESLTRWHFRALAHTPTMEHGNIESEVLVQKDFMVQPNLPRFIRVGDRGTIVTSLVNLSDEHIQGLTRMDLLEPETGRVVYSQVKDFSVPENQTAYISFDFMVTEEIPLLACRVVADGKKFSDGEQRYLPVLSNKIQQIDSSPFVMNDTDTLQQSIKHLFNNQSQTATERRLTMELTGNPAWLAVQALPLIANPENDDALSWAVAYYARALSAHILHLSPRIKDVFGQWHAEGINQETLWSRMQKNQELKTLLLEETPWMAEAANEAEQRKRLALFFDAAWLEEENLQTLTKLTSLQTKDGGWSWFKGMNTNKFITTRIVLLLERLLLLAEDRDTKSLVQSAKTYLDRELYMEYKNMLESEKKGNKRIRPSGWALTYIYSQALTDRKWAEKQEVIDYMLDKLMNLSRSNFTIQEKACAAIVLWKNEQKTVAKEFLNSLMEYTVYQPEQGRYFETPDAYQPWNGNRISTQVSVMEALSLISPNETLILEQMKQWLLIQKRIQCWDTSYNTANAAYALLMNGEDLLSKDFSVRMWIGEKELKSQESFVKGLDYQKQTFTGSEIEKLQPVVRIEKKNKGMVWGAVYAQYMEEIGQIELSSAAAGISKILRIERKYFVERGDNEKSEWIKITKNTKLTPGDKLKSQMVVKVKEDMEFVQLKDPRPACAEALEVSSGYRYNGKVGYYHVVKDASAHYFFDSLPKGTYIINQEMRLDRMGCYQVAPASIQSAYTPEFSAYSQGNIISVDD